MNIKKLNHIASKIFAVTALPQLIMLLFASCATDEVLTNNGEVPIRLSVACQPPTRGTSGASSQATTFDENAKINVTITTSDATPTYICNAAVFTVSAESEGKNSLTPPDVTRPPYYPNGDKTVSIKAFYPSTVSGTDPFAVQTDQTTVSDDETVDTYKLSDLMTASVTGQVKTTSSVNLEFQHRMAKINISATATDGLTIQSINLANVKTTASYASATDTWSGSGDAGTIILAKNGTEATLSGVALFPAQTIEGKIFIQVVTNKGTANYAVTSKAFQEGYEYTANLEVGMQNLTMTAAITDWNTATGVVSVTKVNSYGMVISPISQEFGYNGSAQVPNTVTVKDGQSGEELVEGEDYDLQYYNNVKSGTALVVAFGKQYPYTGSAVVQTYYIGQAESTMAFTNAEPDPVEYEKNGTFSNPVVNWNTDDGNLAFTSSNPDVASVSGSGEVTILKNGSTTISASWNGKGNYKEKTISYVLTVNKRPFSSHVWIRFGGIPEGGYTYDGEAKVPGIAVYDAPENETSGLLTLGSDYDVSYDDNVNAGTVTVTVTGKGKYDSSKKQKTYTIAKADTYLTMNTNLTEKTIGVGETFDFGGTTNYGSIKYAIPEGKESILTVNYEGVITGVGAGDPVTVTAYVEEGRNYKAAESRTIAITVQVQDETFSCTSDVQTITCYPNRIYTFELVGGSGGNYSNGTGGNGGIVKATYEFSTTTTVYLYVGGEGTTTSGGYNGGGNPGSSGGGGGGGATDIRIGGTEASNRVLIAGGGGGATGLRKNGRSGGASTSGNYGDYPYGQNCSLSYGGGGGGGYIGGYAGSVWSGGYGGSNHVAQTSGWSTITNGTSSHVGAGYAIVSYKVK